MLQGLRRDRTDDWIGTVLSEALNGHLIHPKSMNSIFRDYKAELKARILS